MRVPLSSVRGRYPSLCLALSLVLQCMPVGHAIAQSSTKNRPGIIMDATDEGFRYMSGGIGVGEREIMKSWGAPYSLKLSFAEASGVYLSGVHLSILDQKGREVLRIVTNGPWFYIDLPAGAYDIKASVEGEGAGIKDLQLPEGRRVSRILSWDLS